MSSIDELVPPNAPRDLRWIEFDNAWVLVKWDERDQRIADRIDAMQAVPLRAAFKHLFPIRMVPK